MGLQAKLPHHFQVNNLCSADLKGHTRKGADVEKGYPIACPGGFLENVRITNHPISEVNVGHLGFSSPGNLDKKAVWKFCMDTLVPTMREAGWGVAPSKWT